MKEEEVLFICGLFNEAISSSDYTISDDRMVKEKLILNDVEGSVHSPTQGAAPEFA
jgi:hypothetical protein